MPFSTLRGGSPNTPGRILSVQAAPEAGASTRVFCPGCGRFIVEVFGMTAGGCRVHCRHCKAIVTASVSGGRLDVERGIPRTAAPAS